MNKMEKALMANLVPSPAIWMQALPELQLAIKLSERSHGCRLIQTVPNDPLALILKARSSTQK
jgi:hypothetical protein